MDKRNSKEQMLARIDLLEQKVRKVYYAGYEGIEYVGSANYASRESDAKDKLNKAMYGGSK